jgi:hypothetical protein
MKIFGIGWAKTGTTTLETCFQTLGYSHYGYNLSLVDQLDQSIAIARRFKTFQDWPWAIFYKEMDHHFPGSKFVLTIRDSDRWLRSYHNAVSKQVPRKSNEEARRKIYGFAYADATDEKLIERYERHNAEVQEYFSDRPEDLLVVNWEQGDGWKELCSFLGVPLVNEPLPHSNKGVYS